MNNAEYLIFNILIFALSTGSVALAKTKATIAQYPNLRSALFALACISLPYVLWDELVTNWWWYFNPNFTLGWKLGSLPIEELLFFVVVPWSCLIVWVNIRNIVHGKINVPLDAPLSLFILIIFIISIFQFWWYTAIISLLCLVFVILSYMNDQWLQKKSSLIFLTLCFVLTCIFNGYLTARPVVIYSSDVRSMIQLGTIPIEDIFYGLLLLGATVQCYDWYEKKKASL